MTHTFVPKIKTRAMQKVEIRLGRSLEELLDELYTRDGLRQEDIAERLGIDASTLSRWMAQLGIETGRNRREQEEIAS